MSMPFELWLGQFRKGPLKRRFQRIKKTCQKTYQKTCLSLNVLLSATFLSSTVKANELFEKVATPHIISYAAFIAILIFSIASYRFLNRSISKMKEERDQWFNEASLFKARSDRLEALLQSDDQRVIIWPQADKKPDIIGDLPEKCGAPLSSSDFMAFGKWLTAGSAKTLEEFISNLKTDGSSFQLAVKSNQGHYIDVYGRSFGGRLFVRFRDLSGDQQLLLALQGKLSEKTNHVETYQALLEEVAQPVWLKRSDENSGNIDWANRAYREATGIEEKDFHDQKAELFDRDTLENMGVFHKKGSLFKERVQAIADGARKIYDVVSVPTTLGSAGIATDVSEAEKAQAALNRTIKSHEATFNELATAVAIFDKSQRLTFYNKAYQDLFDLDESFLLSRPTDSEVIDKLRNLEKLPVEANFRQWKNDLLKTHQSVEMQEFTWYLPDGQTLRVMASPRATGGVTWIYENMTVRLNLESRVNVLSRLQTETLNRLSDGVAVFSSDGKLTLANSSFIELWGFGNEKDLSEIHIQKLANECIKRFSCDEDWHKLSMAIVAVNEKRDEASGVMERPDGNVIRYSTNALIDGRTMVTFDDITDSVNFERALTEKNEALSEADKLKTDFVKHVNYELRSPLTNIIGFTQLLSDAEMGPLTDKQKEYVDYIMASSSSLLAIINDILDLATAEAGVMELNLGEVSISSVIDNAIEGLKDRLIERNIEIDTELDTKADSFIGDERRIVQILFNLLSNAIHFSDEGSKISLKVEKQEDGLVFQVQDWGMGIPDAFAKQMFDLFESRNSGNTRGGAGLGLSIVKRFVELHDGEVKVKSNEGEGTLVTCRLPYSPLPEKIPAE